MGNNQNVNKIGFLTGDGNKIILDLLPLKEDISKTLKPITKYLTVYVSNTGNDSTADGSQSKPFKKLQKAMDYLASNYYYTTLHQQVTIKFLSDYVETDYLQIRGILGQRTVDRLYLIIDGFGHKVVLNNLRVNKSKVILTNLEIKPTLDFGAGINSELYSQCHLSKTKVYIPSNVNLSYLIRCAYWSSFGFDKDVVFTTEAEAHTTNNIGQFLGVYCHSSFYPPEIVTFEKPLKFIDSVFYCSENSEMRIGKNVQFIGGETIDARKYHIRSSSVINVYGRGPTILPGNKEGLVEGNGYFG